MLLKIVQAGEPVLRRTAQPLSAEDILRESTQQLIGLMRETMREAPGVGLAAPQIGEPLQLVVIEDPTESQQHLTPEQLVERGREPVEFHVLINPELVVEDATPITFFEACLSVSGFHALVPRASGVRVTALNERAEPVEVTARGWYARVLQHEIDHLNGVLYIDRMYRRTLMTGRNFERYWQDKSTVNVVRELGIELGQSIPATVKTIMESLVGDLPEDATVAVGDVRHAWQTVQRQLEART